MNRSPLAALRRFARSKPADQEACDLCCQAVTPEHDHLVDVDRRRLLCACRACALLFHERGQRWKRVPVLRRPLPSFVLDEALWERLQIPIKLVFFLRDSARGQIVALYPSPAGAAESPFGEESWAALDQANPGLELAPDVEVLFLDWLRPPGRAYRLSVDQAFRVVGLVRLHWSGLSGGDRMRAELEGFFAAIDNEATP